MEYVDVTLPNGHVIENVPETASREEIADRAIEAGWATEVDFGRDEPGFLDVVGEQVDKVNPFSDDAAVATMAEYGVESLTSSLGQDTQRKAFVQQLYNQFRDAGLSSAQGLPELVGIADRYRQYSRMPSPPVAEGASLVGMAAEAIGGWAKERREDPAGKFRVHEDYKDTWATDFGGALGSMTAFMMAGAVGGPVGPLFAAGTGLGEGRERLEAARTAGQEISQEQEDAAMLLHGFTGLSEMLPVSNILRRIPADVDDLLKTKIIKRIKEIVSSGVFESIQEQSAGIAHDAIEANVYNPDLNVEDSLYGKIVDLDPSAFGDIFTGREATVSAAAGSFSDFAHGLFRAGSRMRRYNINDKTGREHEQNLRDKKDADILRTQEQVSRAKAGQEIDPWIEDDVGDRPTPLWEQIDLFADEAAQKAVLVGQGMTAPEADEVVLGPNVSPLGRNPIYRAAVHVAKTIGPSFAATDGAFEIVEGGMVTDEAGNRSRTYEVVIGDQRFGAPLPSYEDAAQFASVLHDQRNSTRMSNIISQQIQLFPEELSQEDAGTMAAYGVTVLDPDQTSYTASAVNLAGGTTLDRGYDETASIYEQQEKNVSKSKLTVAQKINLDRINQGLSAKNSFTAEETRKALGKDFDSLSDPKINTTLETETYTVKREANNKIVVVSSDGKTIRGKKLSAVEYQQQLDAGKKPKKDKKYPFKTLRDANAYADTLNKNRGTAVVPNEVLSGDIAAVLESKNISSSVESQEVRNLVGRIIGKETPASIDSLTEGEKKLAYTKIRSLPRFSRPTNLIDFKSPKAAQPVAPEAPLALPAPATAPEVAVIQEALDESMDQAGLSDVKANISHGLSTVLKDNDGNLVFGIRRRRAGDESVESFGGPGSPIVVDSTVDGEAFYSDATGQIFFGLDRLTEGLSTEQKVEAILDILSHEQIHALRALDLFTDAEWTLLRKTAKQRAKSDGQTYFEWAQQNYPEINEVGQIEESIAELVRDYRGGRGAFSGKNKLSGKPKTLLQRIVNFFTGAANFVEGAGFKTFEELASSVESGAVGGRERGQIRTFRETEATGIAAPDQTFGALEEEAPPVAGVRQRPDFSLEDKYSTEDQRRNFLTQRLAFVRGNLEQDTDMYPATRRKLEREARQLSDELRGLDTKDKYSRRVVPLEALPKTRGEAKTLPGAEYFKDGAFEMFSLTPNYSSTKSRETLIVMSPEDFLSLADEAKGDSEKLKPLQELTEKGQKFGDVPFLQFNHDGEGKAKVTGHEGRHRMMALQEVGVPLVPVRLLSGERGEGKAIRWGSQDPASSEGEFDYVKPENFPVTLEAQNKAANPNLSIRFPVSVSEAVPEIRDKYSRKSTNITPYLKGIEEAPELPKTRGKILKRDVGLYLQGRSLEKLEGVPRDLSIAGDRQAIANDLVTEAIYEFEKLGNAVDWYDQTVAEMISMMSLKHPEILTNRGARTALFVSLAITSQEMAVPKNLRLAAKAYAHFAKRGRFPLIGEGNSTKIMKLNFKKANGLIKKLGSMDLFADFLETTFTVAELNTWLEKHLKGTAIGGENVDTIVFGSAVFGPKIGQGFYTNLRGDFNPVTMDMWFMRTIGRLSGDLMKYDEDLFEKQSERFIKEKNLQKNITRETVIEKALETVRQHEKDFKQFRKEYDSGKREKSEAVKAASTLLNSLKNLKDAPTSGGQRNALRKVVALAVDKFNKRTGQNIAPAAFQALIWYPEQDLYEGLGVSLTYARSDYADSTKDLLLKEGFSEKEINKRRDRVRLSSKFRAGRVQQKSGKPDRKTARRPARGSSRVVQEEATRTKPIVQDKYSRDPKKVEKAVEENIAAFENRSVTNQIPRFSLTADPEAQYVARNPEKAFEPSSELLDRYARDNGPDLNDEEKKAVDSLSTDPVPRKTPGQTFIDVTDTGWWTYGLTKLKQETVFNYAELERLYVKGDLEIGDPESSAWRALIFSDKSRALAADAQRHGAVNYDKQGTGIVTTEPFEHNGRMVGGTIDVFTPLYENPYEISLEQLAQSYFVGRRAERLRAEGKKVPGDVEAVATVNALVEDYVNPETGRPIIIEVYETWQAYNEKTIDFLQASGVLDGEKAQIWRDYSDYVPFYREAEGEVDLGGYPSVFGGLTAAVKMAPLKGQERAITIPLLDAVVMNQAMAIDLGLKNIAQQRVIRDMEAAGMARRLPPGSNEPEVRVVSFRIDGKEVRYTVDNPLVYESLLPLDGGFQMMEKVLGIPSTIMRELITRNPSFAAKNILRDTLSSWITSGANYIPILGSLEGLFKGVKALGKFGVVGGFDNIRDPSSLKKTLRKILREKKIKIPKGSRLRGVADAVPLANNFVALWDLLGDLSTASDAAVRYAVYKDTLARTGSDAAATLAAVEVMNFGRRGRNPYARLFTAATPFLNARYQGLDVLYRSHTGRNLAMMGKDARPMARTQQILTAASRGAMLAGISAIWWALVSDDDQYQDTPDEIKDLNVIFPTASGAPFLFPLPFEVGVFYWTAIQRILDYYPVAEMLGKEGGTSAPELKESAKRFAFGTAEGLVFNPLQMQAISPLAEAVMNFDSFKQRHIVPKYIEDANFPELQRTPYTSELAKGLAKALPLPDAIRSPMKLDHLLKGYFPGLGVFVLGLADSLVRSPMVQGDNTKVIPGQGFNLKSADWWDYPFVRRFFRGKYDTGALQDFYTLKRTLNQAMNSLGNENLSLEEKQALYISYAHLLGSSDKYPTGLKDPIKELGEMLADTRKRERAILLTDWPAQVKKNQIDELKGRRDTHNALIHAFKKDADLPASRNYDLKPGEFDRFMELQEIEHQSEMKRLQAPVYKGRE